MIPGDLDLSNPDVFGQGFPHEYFRMLRAEDPVSWNDSKFNSGQYPDPQRGFWSITRHEDLVHVSRHPEIFSSALGGVQMQDVPEDSLENIRAMLPVHGPSGPRGIPPARQPRVHSQDGPPARAAHPRCGDIDHRPRDRNAISAEFVTDIAMHLPMLLICELMGVPLDDQQQIFDWSNQLVAFDDPDYRDPTSSQDEVTARISNYSNQLAAQKRAAPDDTLISRYVNGEVAGEAISDLQLNNFFVLLAIAGNETTRNATTHAVRLLAAHPDQRDLLVNDLDALLPKAVDEILRYEPPVMHFRRTVTVDTEVGGVLMRAGDKVVMWYPSANRDERVFAAPDTFDITRNSTAHLTFGIGEHFCLGASLAKMQLTCIIGEILQRMPTIRPDRRAVASAKQSRRRGQGHARYLVAAEDPADRAATPLADQTRYPEECTQ